MNSQKTKPNIKRPMTVRANIILAIGVTLIGFIFGAGAALYWSGQNQLGSDKPNTIVDGVWKTDFEIGSENASGALRARIARKGLFALKATEAVYYTRSVDASGQSLTVDCDYVLKGRSLPADWWSITLYDETSFLAKNRDRAASINRDQVKTENGAWVATISSQKPEEGQNWISSKGAKTFDLTLRLYQPNLSYLRTGNVSGFPALERVSCSEGSDQ